jgi:chaperone required for assembly of F1-ATPase
MSGWSARRFWKAATVAERDEGYEVLLDGRLVRTPGKSPLILPTPAMAEAIASEWDAQEDTVNPETMPMTRMANSAIEKVAPRRHDVASYLAEYAGTDLLCYRADGPETLVTRQEEAWDPWIDWAETRFGVNFAVAAGVMPVQQAENVVPAVLKELLRFNSHEMVGVHDLIGLSGSAILGLAAASGAESPEVLWPLSRIDEDWQAELWGTDEEAEAASELKKQAFMDAFQFLTLSR